MDFSVYTNQLIEEYNKKMNELIKYKLSLLQRAAEDNGDMFLASLLYKLHDEHNVENVMKELERYGYSLEMDQPQPEYDFGTDTDKYFVKSIIDIEKVKIRVKKLIAEV